MLSLNQPAVLIFLGGGSGAMLRYVVGQITAPYVGTWPVATFCINIIGGFLIGYTAFHVPLEKFLWARPLLMTGFLGGFTTFSAFSLEALTLVQTGRIFAASAYVALSVVGAILACYAGSVA